MGVVMDQEDKRGHSGVLEYGSAPYASGKPWKRSMARSSVLLGIMGWVALGAVILGEVGGIDVVMMAGGVMFIGTNIAAGCGAISSLIQEPDYRRQATIGLILAGVPWVFVGLVVLRAY